VAAAKQGAAKKKTAAKPAASKELTSARKALKEFLTDNPSASIVEVARGKVVSRRIKEPWGDTSFSLRVPDEIGPFAAALNNVKLPNRLSAIWHKDTHDLEVIWTAHNLPKSQVEVAGRSFNFNFKGNAHVCEFGLSSERLLIIAKETNPITMSTTDWRNLQPVYPLDPR
jgi:hypothetical protein